MQAWAVRNAEGAFARLDDAVVDAVFRLTAARDTLEALDAALVAHPARLHLQALRHCITEYDFPAAKLALAPLLQAVTGV